MTRDDKIDGRVRAIVAEALQGHVPDVEAAADAVTAALLPVMGAKAVRKRSEGDMMAAYKEGFFAGRLAGRSGRWHAIIWRASSIYRSLRDPAAERVAERYEKYNF